MQTYETEHCIGGFVVTRTTRGQRLVVFSCVCCKATLLGTFANGFAGQTRWISLAQSLVDLVGLEGGPLILTCEAPGRNKNYREHEATWKWVEYITVITHIDN